MESSGLGRPPFTHWSQASRPSCILTCGKDPNSLNPSIPNAGDVKDRKGNLGFALRAPGVVSEAGKYFVAGVHYLHHFNAEMTHVLRMKSWAITATSPCSFHVFQSRSSNSTFACDMS